ncbi:hypothetical protein, partial [Corynebacterium sp. ACRQJ]
VVGWMKVFLASSVCRQISSFRGVWAGHGGWPRGVRVPDSPHFNPRSLGILSNGRGFCFDFIGFNGRALLSPLRYILQIHRSHTTIGEIMATPLTPRTHTSAELRAERTKVVKQMGPLGVDGLRRLRAADALDVKEADLLDRYESLTWLIEG